MATEATSTSSTDEEIRARKQRRRKTIKLIRRTVVAVLAVAGLAAIVIAMIPKPLAVDVATVAKGTMVVTIDEDGRTRVKDRYVVSAPIAGHLPRVTLYPGDPLEDGAELARLVPVQSGLLDERSRLEAQARLTGALAAQEQARTEVARARAAHDLAKNEVKRQESLWATKTTSQRELEMAQYEQRFKKEQYNSAQFGVKVSAQDVKMARAALSVGRNKQADEAGIILNAPVAGRVLRVIQRDEGVVQAGTPILELGDPTALELVVDVLTQDAVHIVAGSPVTVERWGGDGDLAGRVRRVEPSAFTRVSALGVEEQRVNVIVDLDDPHEKWAALGDGYRIEARIQTWHGEDVIQVPASSVFRHEGGWAVYTDDESVARLTPIEVGHRNQTHIEVTEGLAPGSRVILHPGDQIRDGVAIAPATE